MMQFSRNRENKGRPSLNSVTIVQPSRKFVLTTIKPRFLRAVRGISSNAPVERNGLWIFINQKCHGTNDFLIDLGWGDGKRTIRANLNLSSTPKYWFGGGSSAIQLLYLISFSLDFCCRFCSIPIDFNCVKIHLIFLLLLVVL